DMRAGGPRTLGDRNFAPRLSSRPIELKLSGSLRPFFTLQVFPGGLSRVILLVRSRHLVQYFLHRFRGSIRLQFSFDGTEL
ncbi:MAG: hypothetical protein ACOYLN_12580, partial [Blastocatellia bacterium]